jgi:hypothetical protein
MLESGAKHAFSPWAPATSARSIMETTCFASERHRVIAKAAGYLAEHRGLQSEPKTEDWLKAEHEVDGGLTPHR